MINACAKTTLNVDGTEIPKEKVLWL
jgi:hypothetical protein